MRKVEKTLWGRDVTLEFVYDEKCGMKPSREQVAAGEQILEGWDAVDASLGAVEAYCLDYLPNLDSVPNVFKYVIPHTVYVPCRQKRPSAALLCRFKPDPEQGLAVMFEDGKLRYVCPAAEIG